MSKETSKINIKVDKNQSGVDVRFGDLLPELRATNYIKDTDIYSPAKFYLVRKDSNLISDTSSLVEYSFSNKSITFISDQTDPLKTVINGKMKMSVELNEWDINTEKTFRSSELLRYLKSKKMYFQTLEEYENLISQLSKFNANISTVIQNHNDSKGNLRLMIEQKAETELINNFYINLPLHVNSELTNVKIEICYEARNSDIEFWLESVELKELIKSEVETTILRELDKFGDEVVRIGL